LREPDLELDALAREQITIALRIEPVARFRRAGGDDELSRWQRVDETIGSVADGEQEQRRGDGNERELPSQELGEMRTHMVKWSVAEHRGQRPNQAFRFLMARRASFTVVTQPWHLATVLSSR